MKENEQFTRTELKPIIKEVRIKENLLNEDDATIEICFRQGFASGIIELNKKEYAQLNKQVRAALDVSYIKQTE